MFTFISKAMIQVIMMIESCLVNFPFISGLLKTVTCTKKKNKTKQQQQQQQQQQKATISTIAIILQRFHIPVIDVTFSFHLRFIIKTKHIV